jgi:hypothetical protein
MYWPDFLDLGTVYLRTPPDVFPAQYEGFGSS